MRCASCHQEILQNNPQICPYCGSTEIVSNDIPCQLEEIEKLERAGRYEDAALKYEELEMWDKAARISVLLIPNV